MHVLLKRMAHSLFIIFSRIYTLVYTLRIKDILIYIKDFHSSTLNREQMVSNTSIIRQENYFNRLEIMEALYIKYTKPEINLQTTGMGRTLRLLGDKEL